MYKASLQEHTYRILSAPYSPDCIYVEYLVTCVTIARPGALYVYLLRQIVSIN